jgi:hypothetical protein
LQQVAQTALDALAGFHARVSRKSRVRADQRGEHHRVALRRERFVAEKAARIRVFREVRDRARDQAGRVSLTRGKRSERRERRLEVRLRATEGTVGLLLRGQKFEGGGQRCVGCSGFGGQWEECGQCDECERDDGTRVGAKGHRFRSW